MICGTRYGNVMASRGSVIPLFVEQVLAGQPITVTDPAMTRFMMTLDDAVDLVLYAFEHGDNGDIFVQKAPAATIGRAGAGAAASVHGQARPPRSQVIGTRHGEKLYETLLSREEMAARARTWATTSACRRTGAISTTASSSSRASRASRSSEDYNSHNTDAARRAGDEGAAAASSTSSAT